MSPYVEWEKPLTFISVAHPNHIWVPLGGLCRWELIKVGKGCSLGWWIPILIYPQVIEVGVSGMGCSKKIIPPRYPSTCSQQLGDRGSCRDAWQTHQESCIFITSCEILIPSFPYQQKKRLIGCRCNMVRTSNVYNCCMHIISRAKL